jgi:hypothetical protein
MTSAIIHRTVIMCAVAVGCICAAPADAGATVTDIRDCCEIAARELPAVVSDSASFDGMLDTGQFDIYCWERRGAFSPAAGYLRSYAIGYSTNPTVTRSQLRLPDYRWRRTLVHSAYAGGYTFATSLGIRRGMGRNFKIMRLESAYAYDFVAHVWVANQVGRLFSSLTRWAGYDEKTSRRRGAWWGAFGMMTVMEIFNGFVPYVRLDLLDIPANAIGAWLSDGYLDIVDRHPHLQHFTLQFGWKSVDRLVHGKASSRFLGNAWHDYPNGRFGLGYHVGRVQRPWVTVFATYTVNDMDIAELKNCFGVGVELPVVAWASPLIKRVPGGELVESVYSWLDARFMMPFFYIQIFEIDTPAWSDREPFGE